MRKLLGGGMLFRQSNEMVFMLGPIFRVGFFSTLPSDRMVEDEKERADQSLLDLTKITPETPLIENVYESEPPFYAANSNFEAARQKNIDLMKEDHFDAQEALWKALENQEGETFLRDLQAAIKAGARVNERNQNGKLPLNYCPNHHEAMGILLKAGADPLIENPEGMNSLFYVRSIEGFARLFSYISSDLEVALNRPNSKGHPLLYQFV